MHDRDLMTEFKTLISGELEEHGAIGNGRTLDRDSRSAGRTSTRGSESSEYLAARLKRDAIAAMRQAKTADIVAVQGN